MKIKKEILKKYENIGLTQLVEKLQDGSRKERAEIEKYIIYTFAPIVQHIVNKYVRPESNKHAMRNLGALSKKDFLNFGYSVLLRFFYNYKNINENKSIKSLVYRVVQCQMASYIREVANTNKNFWKTIKKFNEFREMYKRYPTKIEAKELWGVTHRLYDYVMSYKKQFLTDHINEHNSITYRKTPEINYQILEKKKYLNETINSIENDLSRSIIQLTYDGFSKNEILKMLNISNYLYEKYLYFGFNYLKQKLKELNYDYEYEYETT